MSHGVNQKGGLQLGSLPFVVLCPCTNVVPAPPFSRVYCLCLLGAGVPTSG